MAGLSNDTLKELSYFADKFRIIENGKVVFVAENKRHFNGLFVLFGLGVKQSLALYFNAFFL